MSISPSKPKSGITAVRELTIRSVILGGIITLVFTAANVYLGLKVGLTFATSIPAAVISMAILKWFKSHTIVENNIVQTVASAAGTLSAIVFVLPGLVMIGWWSGFPYWMTMFLCTLGGILGVMYSIPLRRALVTGSDLPYPEGVAAAEVLKVGDTTGGATENKQGLKVIVVGAIGAAAYSLASTFKVVSSGINTFFRVGSGATMIGASLSMALLGVGHLVGLSVGIAMVVGILISYGILLPIRTAGIVDPTISDTVEKVFSSDVRFIGAGTIAIAALWTLFKLIIPIFSGIKDAFASTRDRRAGKKVALTEQDLPITIVIGVILASMVPIGFLLWSFAQDTAIHGDWFSLLVVSVIFILLIGLLVASVCGYMAGLIGASNSPISGVGILVAITAALLIKTVHGSDPKQTTALIAYTLFTSAIVFGVATISNDNLQDLKTGQLVGATPWKQQVALVIGVVFGSIIIPPVLDLMNKAFGFAGAPGAGPDALPAPQASLISSLAKGVLGGNLPWGLLFLGVAIGAVVIVINEVLLRTTRDNKLKFALPPLAVGMGMYLPMHLTVIIFIGSVAGMFYERWAAHRKNPEHASRLGVLLATGLIVGESLFGVIYAGIVVVSGKAEPLALVGNSFVPIANVLGILTFAGGAYLLIRWVKRLSILTEK